MKLRGLAKKTVLMLILAAAAGFGAWNWWQSQQDELPEGIVSGNGRMEADQVDIAAKSAGRIKDVLAQEGDEVSAGQVLAHIDITELQAQRAKYVAELAAEEASILEAKATVVQRKAEQTLKEANLRRTRSLFEKGTASEVSLDEAQSEHDAAKAILEAAEKNVTARERSVDAARALIELTEAQIADATLYTPVRGRVLYRLANPGEVVSAGGKVLTILKLDELYMEIYLPMAEAMRVSVGDQARIIFDDMDFAIPAKVSFVSPEAQFTPKQVETRSERDKLMFRVKLRVPKSLIERHFQMVKSGARATGYVRLEPNPPEWPDFLQKRFEGDPIDVED